MAVSMSPSVSTMEERIISESREVALEVCTEGGTPFSNMAVAVALLAPVAPLTSSVKRRAAVAGSRFLVARSTVGS